MNTKKILLPESDFKGRTRTRKRKREEATELHKNSEGTFSTRPLRSKCATLVTDQRQRNDDINKWHVQARWQGNERGNG